jgi:hypothetical protein
VLAEEAHAHHRRVPWQDPGVVRGEQRAAVRRHVLHALRPDAPPAVVEELEHREHRFRELFVEAPFVLVVVAGEPPRRDLRALPGAARQACSGARECLREVEPGVEALAQRAQERRDDVARPLLRRGHQAATPVAGVRPRT